MGSFSILHWLVVIVAVVILFGGRGRLSSIMGDVAKGVTAFRKGLKDDDARKEDLVNVTPPKKDDSAPS